MSPGNPVDSSSIYEFPKTYLDLPRSEPLERLRIPDPTDPLDISQIDFHALYNERFISLADDALRAGVVINFLDIRGLQNNPEFADASTSDGWNLDHIKQIQGELFNKMSPAVIGAILSMELKKLNDSLRDALNPLPVKTGGVFIENSNFFLSGIGKEAESLMKGYYLVSYAPPSDTFKSDGKETYNNIKVNVRRRNVQVYTRDGFYNRLESEAEAAAQAAHPLQDAIFSPFMHADLNVNIAAGYIKDAKVGHVVRSWIHIDPKDVKVIETEDGGARINLEMACLTSDTNGFVQDFKLLEHILTIVPENKAENLALIQKHGIRFALLLPVKKPGSYYVRIAVRDKDSGNTGSAYQFIEIPNLDRKGLALSNIFLLTSADDLNWLRSDVTAEAAEGLFFPVFQAREVSSPALRTYAVGDNLQILTMLYNAEEKAIADSDIEMQFILYRDGKEFMRNEPKPVISAGASNPDGIPILQELTIGSDMPPGDYVLQLVATDKKNGKKPEGDTTQAISFTVTESR